MKILTISGVAGFAAVALFFFSPPRTGAHSAPGKIEGLIVNGTKGAKVSSVANLPVFLHLVLDGPTHTISQTTQTDADGQFSFSLQDTPPPTYYLVETNFSGVAYSSEVVPYDPAQTRPPIRLTVYETTTDPSVVRVTQMHFIFDVRTRAFNVLQVVAVQNAGDRTFIGAPSADARRATLSLPILAGASNLQFERREAAAGAPPSVSPQGDAALTYTLPILPGADQIVYGYSVPFTPPTYQFDLKMPVNAEKFRLVLLDVGATISSSQLTAASPIQAQSGQRFLSSTADDLRAGTRIEAAFVNLPATVAEPTRLTKLDQSAQLVAASVLAAVGIAAAALLVYPLARRRAAPVSRRMELLQTIANLDDDFQAGKLSGAEHAQKRAAAKAELIGPQ